MAETIDGLSPAALKKQLENERTQRERAEAQYNALKAQLVALKAGIVAREAPEILVDVASVLLEAQEVMNTASASTPLEDRVSTGRPGSRTPERNRRPVKAFRRFKIRVDGAVNGWLTEKERDFEPPERDPEEYARVWCCRRACSLYQVSLPKFARSKKLGWVALAPICNGDVSGETCGRPLKDRP